jgi:hypothetical protein
VDVDVVVVLVVRDDRPRGGREPREFALQSSTLVLMIWLRRISAALALSVAACSGSPGTTSPDAALEADASALEIDAAGQGSDASALEVDASSVAIDGSPPPIDAAAPDAEAAADPCSPLPDGLTTWTKTDTASSGTPDTYFFDVTPGDPFCASITGGGSGAWSLVVSNGTSGGVYCSGAAVCSILVPSGEMTLLTTAVTEDIGGYTLTVRYRPR